MHVTVAQQVQFNIPEGHKFVTILSAYINEA